MKIIRMDTMKVIAQVPEEYTDEIRKVFIDWVDVDGDIIIESESQYKELFTDFHNIIVDRRHPFERDNVSNTGYGKD